MTLLFALMCPVLLQAPPAGTDQEVERLRKANGDLQEQVDLFRKASVSDARTIQRLKQIIRALKAQMEALAAQPPAPKPGLGLQRGRTGIDPGPDVGPERPLKGKVVFVDARNKFVMIDIGLRDGVEAGYRFEINRVVRKAPGEEPETLKLGTAVFEKYMGEKESMSKLNILDGNPAEIRMDDEAVALRKLGKIERPVKKEKPRVIQPGVYRITGNAGIDTKAGFIINYGANQGAKQTDVVYVYKDGNLKARLRLDTVEKTFSVANVIDGSMIAKPVEDDQVYTRELNKELVGKVAGVDEKLGVAVDVRKREGARVGQRFQVRRQGRNVGVVVLYNIQAWGAWARIAPGTRLKDIKPGDFAELIKE